MNKRVTSDMWHVTGNGNCPVTCHLSPVTQKTCDAFHNAAIW